MLTTRADAEARSNGSMACVTANVPKKLVSKTRRTASKAYFAGGPIAGIGDAGVVDQYVQVTVLRPDGRGSGRDDGRIVQVDGNEMGIDTLCSQGRDGRGPAACVPRAEQNAHSARTQLASDLKADALVGAGDQSDAQAWSLHPDVPFTCVQIAS
jgi:hypothetical protein